jgi:chromosome segregation ATPase
MYSKDDTLDLFEKVKDHIRSAMSQELGYFLNMNAIMVQLLLHEAEKQKTNLHCEIAQIENMQNMKEMNEFINSLQNLNIPTSGKNKSLGKLGSISSIEGLIKENEIMKHDNDMLNQQVETLNNKSQMLATENENLTKQNKDNSQTILELRKEIQNLTQKISESHQSESKEAMETLKKLEKESHDAKKKLDEQVEKYQQLVASFDKKVSESAQFKTLKKILQDKNTLIVQLKTKVAKYENQD